jgi:hypothetical protein
VANHQAGALAVDRLGLWQHPRLPRPDAVKILPVDVSSDKDYRVRFEREADVGVHDRGDADGQQLMGVAIDGRADQSLAGRYRVPPARF